MTNSVLAAIQAAAAEAAAVSAVDMNEAKQGGGGRILESGEYFGIVTGYIDLGNQPQEFEGKAKDPAPEFQFEIALHGLNEDGTLYVYRPYSLAISQAPKSNTFKAFKAMNWRNDANVKHFAQFIGQAFFFTIEKYTAKSTGKPANKVIWDKTRPPIDPMTKQPYGIPAHSEDLYRAFFWTKPTLVAWDSLKIEGTFDDGRSKNFIQEKILGATNFSGSELEMLLATNQRAYSVPEKKAAPATAPVAAIAPPPAAAVVVAAPAVAPAPAPAAAVVTAPLPSPAAVPTAATATVEPAAPAPVATSTLTSPSEVAAPLVSAPAPSPVATSAAVAGVTPPPVTVSAAPVVTAPVVAVANPAVPLPPALPPTV